MYYIEKNNKIVLFNENRKKIEDTMVFIPEYQDLEIKETDRPIVDFEFADTEEYQKKEEQKEKERVARLKMTPLDFLKCLQGIGVTYEQIKQLCDSNSQVDMELKFCNHVYRGNPLLDQLAGQFNVTSEQLDTLFKTYGG